MNIFIMILVTVFMVGYYMISSPSTRITESETEYAINRADMRSITECTVAHHNAQIKGTEFVDICAVQNKIVSKFICMNSRLQTVKCEIVRNRKPDFSYIVTATAPISPDDYNGMMEILEQFYPDAGSFGILNNGKIISGGTSNHRKIPDAIIKEMELADGQLVYMTQYEMPDAAAIFTGAATDDLVCPTGTVKTYRFGRWQCIGYNTKTDCNGDTIWDSVLRECVADESRRPLCAGGQTAILVDEVWECISPFPEKQCPDNLVAQLNYNTLEWECIEDPNATATLNKCDKITGAVAPGVFGGTLRLTSTSCTDCERMITDATTCTTTCVPDPAQVNNPACYPGGRAADCRGDTRGLYFGFPSPSYLNNIPELAGKEVPFTRDYNQNRQFNCKDCGARGVDTERSTSPYVTICNE